MIAALDNSLESLRTRLQNSQLGFFLRWWGGELREMLPARLRAGVQHARRRLVLKIHADELVLSVYDGGVLHELEVVSLGEDTRLLQQRIAGLLSDRELTEVARDLALPEDRVLSKEVILPLAAEANLRQALAFEMDRQTPFRADDVFFDYQILGRDKEHGQIRVEMMVTPRQPLLREIERLEPLGMAPSGVDMATEGGLRGINLLPLDMRKRVVNSRIRMNWLLLAAMIALLVLVMAQSLWLRQHQINEVQQAIDEVRSEALQVQQIRKRIEDASEAAGFLNSRRAASPPAVKVLDEVTQILPDDTYLDRLLIEAESVQLQGKSQNAQQLIELVNESPMFKDASFRGPTRLDSRTQKEMFDINAALEGTAEE